MFSIDAQCLPCTIDIEIKHGHGSLVRRPLSSFASFGGPFQRDRDLLRVVHAKHTILQIERMTIPCDSSRPVSLCADSLFLRGRWSVARHKAFLPHRLIDAVRLHHQFESRAPARDKSGALHTISADPSSRPSREHRSVRSMDSRPHVSHRPHRACVNRLPIDIGEERVNIVVSFCGPIVKQIGMLPYIHDKQRGEPDHIAMFM
jgi:hypothetical protein